jgi:OmpA-OmpF porin, OOP family
MNKWRFIRVTLASGLALTTATSTFLVGCVHKVKKEPPGRGVICDPVPPPVDGHLCVDSMPIMDNILFENDKTALQPGAKAVLDKLCALLKAHPKDTVKLVGHASDDGSHEHNMALGEGRAKAAKAYLIEQGIAPERLAIESKGDAQPAVPNDTPENRKLNRRVIFDISIHD